MPCERAEGMQVIYDDYDNEKAKFYEYFFSEKLSEWNEEEKRIKNNPFSSVDAE